MTPEAQQIAIAKACGWKDVKYTKHEEVDIENRSIIHWSELTGIPPEFTHYKNRIRIPDYLNDLNAMHEAEKAMSVNDRNRYIDTLGTTYHDSWEFCTATAAQRAEAFLRTINKWETGQ